MNPAPWRVQTYEAIGSTSDLCCTLAISGEPARLAVRSVRQTAARGSRGRSWETLPGNLAMSVLLRPTGPVTDAGHWALMAAVALAEAIEAVAPGPPIGLKWPNDLMLDKRKLGGILIDTAVGTALEWLVIGFGANLGMAPEGAAIRMAEADRVASALLERLDAWDRTRLIEGFAPVRRAWLDRGPEIGSLLQIRTGQAIVGGLFVGLSDSGALLLQSSGRVRAFSTGEILLAGA